MKGHHCMCVCVCVCVWISLYALLFFSYWQLFDKMCMTLGGRAAEVITFRKITTGGYI